MTETIKTLLIIVLIALILAVVNDNRHLQARNARLVNNIRQVVMDRTEPVTGLEYAETATVVKALEVERLTR